MCVSSILCLPCKTVSKTAFGIVKKSQQEKSEIEVGTKSTLRKMGDSDDDMDYGGGGGEKRRDKFRSERGGSPPSSRDRDRGSGGRRYVATCSGTE